MKLKFDLNYDQLDAITAKHLKKMYKEIQTYPPITEEDKKELKKIIKAVRRVHNYLTAQENHI